MKESKKIITKAFPIYIYIYSVQLAILCEPWSFAFRPILLLCAYRRYIYILELGTINLTRLTPIIPCPYLSISRNHKEYSVFLVVSVYRRSCSNRWKKFLSLSFSRCACLSLLDRCREREREAAPRSTFISNVVWRLAINPDVISIKYLP